MADSTLTGNHWVCIYHHFSTNLWIYADSLGFSPPEHLFQTLRPFRETVQQIYVIDNCDDINLIIAHTHGIQSNINCTKRCIQHFPCQGNDMNICGVASIMSAIVLRNKRFISDILAHKKLPQIYSWLSKLERYSDFLRRVLIIWFLEKRIDLSLINMKTKVKEVPTFLKFWRVIIHSSASWLHSTRIFCKLDTFAKVCLSKTCYLWKDIQRFVLEFYLLLQISSDVSPKKLYKKRKSSWIYQIFKNFETLFSLSNVFAKDRSYENPNEFIFSSVSSNWNVHHNIREI